MVNKNVANLILKSRKAKGLSQRKLAELLGYHSGQYVSNFERGECSLPMMKFIECCDILGIRYVYLRNALIKDYTAEVHQAFEEYEK